MAKSKKDYETLPTGEKIEEKSVKSKNFSKIYPLKRSNLPRA